MPVAESRIRVRLQLVTSVSRAFPKSKRLLRHADFQRVYEVGRRQFTGNMTVFFLRRTISADETASAGSLRVGFTVGKALGGAVERNRLKRRMREAVRTSWPATYSWLSSVLVRHILSHHRHGWNRNEGSDSIRVARLQTVDFADAAARLPFPAHLFGI